MSDRISPRGIDPEGVADGDYTLTVSGGHVTGLAAAAGGGSGGVVESIIPGSGISVDSTDPANPVVSATGGGGGGGAQGLRYWVKPANVTLSPYPTSYATPSGLTLTIPSAAVARTAFVSFNVHHGGGHNNRFVVHLDGSINSEVCASMDGGESNRQAQLHAWPIALTAGSAHTIDVRTNAMFSTEGSTLSGMFLIADVYETATSPISV